MEWKRRKRRNEGGEKGPPKTHKLGLTLYFIIPYISSFAPIQTREREKQEKASLRKNNKKLWIPPLPVLRDGCYAACFSGLFLFFQIRSDPILYRILPITFSLYFLFLFYFVSLFTIHQFNFFLQFILDVGGLRLPSI